MLCFFKRTAARFIDYLLWGMLTVAVLGDKTGNIYSPSLFFYASFWIYPFVEAALLNSFATTAGKKLTGVYVFDAEGKKLSYRSAWKRSFLVFGMGMGFFLPYISLILPACTAILFFRRKGVFWDKSLACSVKCVKTSLWDKMLLAGFLCFLAAGYFLTVRMAYLHREPDFDAIRNNVLSDYFENIRPQMVAALSPEAVLTPRAAVQAGKRMETVQKLLQEKSDELSVIKTELQKRLDKMSINDLKRMRERQLKAVLAELDSFLFSEKMRAGLFESMLNAFQSEEKNKYTLVDGVPVFQDEGMKRQYDSYMTQLQIFLSLGEPANVQP